MRLKDLTVEEVSLVDKAANKKKFFIVKRDNVTEKENNTIPNVAPVTVTQNTSSTGVVATIPMVTVMIPEAKVEVEELDVEDIKALEAVVETIANLESEVGNL